MHAILIILVACFICYRLVRTADDWIFIFFFSVLHLPVFGIIGMTGIRSLTILAVCGSFVAIGYVIGLLMVRKKLPEEDAEKVSEMISKLFTS